MVSRSVGYKLSGGRFAILNFRIPMPASSTMTVDNSPGSLWYSNCPRVISGIARIRSLRTNLIYTLRHGPSIWIILMSDSCRRKFSSIHLCIWKAEILVIFRSKIHTILFWRSILIRYQHGNKHSTYSLPDITNYTLSLRHALCRTTAHHYESKQTS